MNGSYGRCPCCGEDLTVFGTNECGTHNQNIVECRCGWPWKIKETIANTLNMATPTDSDLLSDHPLFIKADDIPIDNLVEGMLVAHKQLGVGIVFRSDRLADKTLSTNGCARVIFLNYSPSIVCNNESLCVVRLNSARWLSLLQQSNLISYEANTDWYAPAGFNKSIQQTVEAGEACRKGVPGCMCKIGWPPDKQCPNCREEHARDSYCVCPPDVEGK